MKLQRTKKKKPDNFTCFKIILATSLTVSDGHQFSPWALMATHSILCIGQSPLWKTNTRESSYRHYWKIGFKKKPKNTARETRDWGLVTGQCWVHGFPLFFCGNTHNWESTRQKQRGEKCSYLAVHIAVVCLLTFPTFKQVFSPGRKTQYVGPAQSSSLSLCLKTFWMSPLEHQACSFSMEILN